MQIEIEKKARVSGIYYLELARNLEKEYGKAKTVHKSDIYFKNKLDSDCEKFIRLRKHGMNTVWRSADNGSYEINSKVKNTLDDGTEVNQEIETLIRVADTDTLKSIFDNVGLELFFEKVKDGFEWNIETTIKKEKIKLHAELLLVTSSINNNYSDYFLEIECTDDLSDKVSAEMVAEKIMEIFNKFGLSDIETKSYKDLITSS